MAGELLSPAGATTTRAPRRSRSNRSSTARTVPFTTDLPPDPPSQPRSDQRTRQRAHHHHDGSRTSAPRFRFTTRRLVGPRCQGSDRAGICTPECPATRSTQARQPAHDLFRLAAALEERLWQCGSFDLARPATAGRELTSRTPAGPLGLSEPNPIGDSTLARCSAHHPRRPHRRWSHGSAGSDRPSHDFAV